MADRSSDRGGLSSSVRWLALGALSAFAVGGITLFYPPGADQGIFLYVGRALSDGGLPYRDAFDIKPPGIYAFYALADRLFGRNLWGYRLLELLLLSGAILPIRRICRATRIAHPFAAFLAWLTLYFVGQTYWEFGQAESVIAVVAVGYLALLTPALDAGAARRAALYSGLLLGLALVFKQTMLPLGLAFLAWTFYGAPDGRLSRRELATRAGLHALGATVFPLAVVLVYAVAGALDALYLAVVQLPAAYASAPALTNSVGDWLRVALQRPVPTLLVLFGLVVAFRYRPTESMAARRTMLAWSAGLAIAVIVQGKLWSYHMTLLIPALALLLALGLGELTARLRDRHPALVRSAIVAMLLLATLSIVGLAWEIPRNSLRPTAPGNLYARAWPLTVGYLTGTITRAEYYSAFRGPVGHLAPDSALELAAGIRQACPQGRSVQLFDFWPTIYIFGDARNEHRFFMITHPVKYGQLELQRELVSNLYAADRADCVVLPDGVFPPDHALHPAQHGYVSAGRRTVGGGTPVTVELFHDRR